VPVQILALSLVAAQLMRAGKVALDHHFKKTSHACQNLLTRGAAFAATAAVAALRSNIAALRSN
jgi:hypothetical protein